MSICLEFIWKISLLILNCTCPVQVIIMCFLKCCKNFLIITPAPMNHPPILQLWQEWSFKISKIISLLCLFSLNCPPVASVFPWSSCWPPQTLFLVSPLAYTPCLSRLASALLFQYPHYLSLLETISLPLLPFTRLILILHISAQTSPFCRVVPPIPFKATLPTTVYLLTLFVLPTPVATWEHRLWFLRFILSTLYPFECPFERQLPENRDILYLDQFCIFLGLGQCPAPHLIGY